MQYLLFPTSCHDCSQIVVVVATREKRILPVSKVVHFKLNLEGVVLSLMKMETIVNANITGKVVKVVVSENDVIKEGGTYGTPL